MQMDLDDDGNMWPEILPPILNAPANGLTGVLVSLGLTIGLMPFQSGYDVHVSTDYQIVDTATGNVVWSSIGNVLGLLGLIVPALTLSAGKTYRIQARFNGVKFKSEWSDAITIST